MVRFVLTPSVDRGRVGLLTISGPVNGQHSQLLPGNQQEEAVINVDRAGAIAPPYETTGRPSL